MAVVGKLKASGVRVIVIGTGYGAFESARESRIFGSLLPSVHCGRIGMVAVATRDGGLSWCPSHEIEILEVDGVPVADMLCGDDAARSAADLRFPAVTPEEVREHPQFSAFLKENPDRQYLCDGRLESEFGEWQMRQQR